MVNFSVLMSLYNGEKSSYLSACLKSIEQQTLLPDEIILVFDGFVSTKLSLIVEESKKKLHIKIVQLPVNIGLGKALNAGLVQCQYELVARMDTDDICLPDRFEKQITYMQLHPEIAILGCNITEFDETMTSKISQRIVPSAHSDIVQFSKLKSPFNHMGVVFRKSIIEKVGGYQHHLYMEDYNLWLRVIANDYKVANLYGSYLHVRAGESMIERRRGLKYVKSEFQLAKLKIALGIQNRFSAGFFFIIRSIPRFMPLPILKLIYRLNRNS